MKRVTNGYDKLSEVNFKDVLSNVLYSMRDNPFFPGLQADVATLAAQTATYFNLATKASDGSKEMIAARNASKKILIQLLQAMGMHVSAIALGNEAALVSSGFPFTRTRQSTQNLVRPQPPKVTPGVNNGEIVCKTKKQKGMLSVNFFISTTPEDAGSWRKENWFKTSYTFSKLKSGQRYYFKVGFSGVRGQEVISEAVSYISQ